MPSGDLSIGVARTGSLIDLLGLGDCTIENDIAILSPPQNFAGGEDEYEERIGGQSADALSSGRGAWRMARGLATRPIERLLEIGAGAGACSLGLVEGAGDASVLVTDTSPAFLRLVRRKVEASGFAARIGFATLAGEDLALLPPESLDAIVVASAVHHVMDWRSFLRTCAERLRPGGVFLMQEPFREGNLIMAFALDFVLSTAWPKRDALSAEDRTKVSRCRDSIYLLADSTADKANGEDKHNFLVDEVASAAQAVGFASSAFFVNTHFAELPLDLSQRRNPCGITQYLHSFLRFHHGVSDRGLERIFKHLAPLMSRMNAAYMRADGPALLACVGLRR